jgi:3-keto-5-aminohexanoate cleavage enzyme
MEDKRTTELFTGYMNDLHLEKSIPTMDRKLIINVAPTGSFVTRQQNEHVPYSPAEIAAHAIAAYREGASVLHMHCRYENGIPCKDPLIIKDMIDEIIAECPDMVMSVNMHSDHTQQGPKMFAPIVEHLSAAGSRYIETGVVTPFSYTFHPERTIVMSKPIVQDIVLYLQEKGIKPEFQGHTYEAIRNVKDWLIETGILKARPYLVNLVTGWHGWHHAGPGGPDPWGHLYLMTMLQMLPEGSVAGLAVGGHNWLPLTVQGIMLGVEYARVGMEDTLWMYPHRDEKIKNCGDVVRKVATIARELGREIATPEEARQIMGLNPLKSV